jgi:DNA-binding MarR family transcriptional regulator
MTEQGEDRDIDGEEALFLSNQLCFALHSTTLALGRVYQRVLAPLGLTYTQYLAMLVLWERERVSVKDLGAALILDSGTLTPLLKRLEQAGLVERRRDEADERRVLVAPTAQGWSLRQRALEVPHRIMEACGGAGVPLSRLKGDLEALRTALIAVPGAPASGEGA